MDHHTSQPGEITAYGCFVVGLWSSWHEGECVSVGLCAECTRKTQLNVEFYLFKTLWLST